MADIAAFPTLHDILVSGDNIQSFKTSEAVKAGQVAGFDTALITTEVKVMKAVAGENAVGVFLYDAEAGDYVAVAQAGCVVRVVNADDAADIAAGAWAVQNANAVGGTVSAYAGTGAAKFVGQMMEFNSGGAAGVTSEMLVMPHEEVIA